MAKKPMLLSDLFHETLKDIYFAENKLLKTLPKMAKAAQSKDLQRAFTKHLRETEGQVKRLDQVFRIIGKPARGKTCAAINGITEEGAEIMKDFKGMPALDAGLLAAAQAGSTMKCRVTAPCGPGPKNSVCRMPPNCSKRPWTKRRRRTRLLRSSLNPSSTSKQNRNCSHNLELGSALYSRCGQLRKPSFRGRHADAYPLKVKRIPQSRRLDTHLFAPAVKKGLLNEHLRTKIRLHALHRAGFGFAARNEYFVAGGEITASMSRSYRHLKYSTGTALPSDGFEYHHASR
jgi:hypothetical protein